MVEIESKYCFKDANIFDNILNYLKDSNYLIEIGKEKEQIDTYYDTDELLLKTMHCSLRIRQKDGFYELTIKKPTRNYSCSACQHERFEYQLIIEDTDLISYKKFINEHLGYIKHVEFLHQTLIIRNLRTPITITQGKIKFEMVFDHVTYYLKDIAVNSYQIEIELKSDYEHRVYLKAFSGEIEKNIDGLIPQKELKYEIGLRLMHGQ